MKGIMQTLRIRNLILITSLTCHSLMLIEKDLMLSILQFPSSPPLYSRLSIVRTQNFFYHYTSYANECLLLMKKSENPRASWAYKNQLRPDKPSGKRHFLTNTKPVIFFTKACNTLLKKQSSRAAISHIFGDPAVFWQDGVLEHKKEPFICRQNYLSNSTWKCLWEIKPYTISLVKQPQDAICCHPNCSRERLPYHGSQPTLHAII